MTTVQIITELRNRLTGKNLVKENQDTLKALEKSVPIFMSSTIKLARTRAAQSVSGRTSASRKKGGKRTQPPSSPQ